MPVENDSDLIEEAWQLVKLHGNASEAARASGIPRKTLTDRATRYAVNVKAFMPADWTYPEHVEIELRGKTLLVGGDAHFWPGQKSLIWEAFVEAAHELQPDTRMEALRFIIRIMITRILISISCERAVCKVPMVSRINVERS